MTRARTVRTSKENIGVSEHIETGLLEAFAELEATKIGPAAVLMVLFKQGDMKRLLPTMNKTFAVTKYGGKTVIARTIGKDVDFINEEDFHRMFANLIIVKDKKKTTVSKLWFEWEGRRQYLGRGVVFEPGGTLELENDMLNLWRGFGVRAKAWRLVTHAQSHPRCDLFRE